MSCIVWNRVRLAGAEMLNGCVVGGSNAKQEFVGQRARTWRRCDWGSGTTWTRLLVGEVGTRTSGGGRDEADGEGR